MRANALLKLLMGSAGGLVLAVAGVQCQPGVTDNTQNSTPNINQVTMVDPPKTLGMVSDGWVNWGWDPIVDWYPPVE